MNEIYTKCIIQMYTNKHVKNTSHYESDIIEYKYLIVK